MLKRLIFWEYPRESWEYGLIVAIILAFIFIPPREWFRDQPRIAGAGQVALLPSEHGNQVAWMHPSLLEGVSETGKVERATGILRGKTGNKHLLVTRVEAIRDSENEIQGYFAFARP
jgi:hypothetical protein